MTWNKLTILEGIPGAGPGPLYSIRYGQVECFINLTQVVVFQALIPWIILFFLIHILVLEWTILTYVNNNVKGVRKLKRIKERSEKKSVRNQWKYFQNRPKILHLNCKKNCRSCSCYYVNYVCLKWANTYIGLIC